MSQIDKNEENLWKTIFKPYFPHMNDESAKNNETGPTPTKNEPKEKRNIWCER